MPRQHAEQRVEPGLITLWWKGRALRRITKPTEADIGYKLEVLDAALAYLRRLPHPDSRRHVAGKRQVPELRLNGDGPVGIVEDPLVNLDEVHVARGE